MGIIGKLFRQTVLSHIVKRDIKKEQHAEELQILRSLSQTEHTALTDIEKQQVCEMLGVRLNSFEELSFFKHERGFSPLYIPHVLYLPLLARRLNDYRYSKFFEHKSLLGLFHCGLRFPKCYVRCVDGEYYDDNMCQMSFEEAVGNCSCHDMLVFKSSVDSSGGQSVSKLCFDKESPEGKKQKLKAEMAARHGDFVIQECLKQHQSMARFCPTSINTLRITSLYLNGQFSLLSVVLRFGKLGMTVDNWGAGGIMVGVEPDGKLHEYGYDINLNKYYECEGIVLKDAIVTQLPAILKELEKGHKTTFSLCKLIGWDVCIDENNKPVIVELNSSQPGIFAEQLCTGPIFGNRTREVIDYCNSKPFVYNKALLKY